MSKVDAVECSGNTSESWRRRGDGKEDAVRWMPDGHQMHVGEGTGRRMLSDGCQTGIGWVSDACRRGGRKEGAVRWMSDGCQMHVGEGTGRRMGQEGGSSPLSRG